MSAAYIVPFALLIGAYTGHAACGVDPPDTCNGTRDAMRAFVARSTSDFALDEDVALPTLGSLRRKFTGLPASCEVLVSVRGSSVNPADRSTPGPFPQVLGSDLAGVVIAVESGCQRLTAGESVWGDIGAVVWTDRGKGKENGAFGEFVVALESQLVTMPRNLDYLEAGALPKVALTSYKALAWYGGAPYTKRDVTVLVLGGSGGCGSTGIQLAKAFGAQSIITTTSSSNADYVKQLGAQRVIDYKVENWWDVLPHGSVDVIYDTVGANGTGDHAMTLLKSDGFYVTITGALPTKPRGMFIRRCSSTPTQT
eukprot:TRINITY_DN26970_c0_g1_i2.p1 TRINITY_DN26970_c0_g1~~TRINITY_DN26970_c0_g1_i2.p1  ORF type:complete len:326 (+),score=33.14 TRINITY_DN26970_c0_g1_i2:46-978(+)